MCTADASFSLTRWQHSTFLREITSRPPCWNYDIKSKIQLSRCVTLLSNFILIRSEMTDPLYDRAIRVFVKWRHGHHFESTSHPKSDSVNRCTFTVTQWTILPNVILIWFEMTDSLFRRGSHNKTKNNNKISSNMRSIPETLSLLEASDSSDDRLLLWYSHVIDNINELGYQLPDCVETQMKNTIIHSCKELLIPHSKWQ